MCDLGFEIGRQVYDVDGIEWAFLGANTASNTESLRDEGDFGLGGHFDAELASSNDGT